MSRTRIICEGCGEYQGDCQCKPDGSLAPGLGSEARVEVRVNGKLMIGFTAEKVPTDADETFDLLATVRAAASGPSVPDPELI